MRKVGMLGLLLLVIAPSWAAANEMRTIAKGAFSGIQERVELVITNQAQWVEAWKRHSAQVEPKKEPPEVDFTKETVLFVALGRKPTGGYSVEISEVRRTNGQIEVIIVSRAPKPGGLNLQALTAPFHAVAIPKVTGEVKFKRQ